MKALVFSNGELSLNGHYPLPERKKGEALVKVLVAGICNTDLEILAGYMDFSGVPGHEFVGVVEDADTGALVGRRVVGEINVPCGNCPLCRAGLQRHCRNRSVLGIQNRDGAFADYLTLPEANLHFVHDALPDETAVFTEPVAAAFRILEEIKTTLNERSVILGDGKLGILIAQVLRPRCRVTLVGHNQGKLAIARSLGIDAFPESALRESDFDLAVDATGSAEGFKAALSLVRPAGTLVVKTTVAGDIPAPMWRVVVDEITIVGSRCGPFGPALEALHDGSVRPEPLVTATFALCDYEAAFAKAREAGALKVLLNLTGAK